MANSDLEAVLRALEDTFANASRLPLSSKIIVDSDKVLNLLERLYASLPDELIHARSVLSQSDKLLESIEVQGKRIIHNAQQEAAKLIEQADIKRQAEEAALEIVAHAQRQAEEIKHQAVVYADDVLHQLGLDLERLHIAIGHNRRELAEFDASKEAAAEKK